MNRKGFLGVSFATVILVAFVAGMFLPGCPDKKSRDALPTTTVYSPASVLSATEEMYEESNVVEDSRGLVLLVNNQESGHTNFFVDGEWINAPAGRTFLDLGLHTIEWWEVDLNSPDLNNQRRTRQIAAFQVLVIEKPE